MANNQKPRKKVDKRQRMVRIVAVMLCLLLLIPLLANALSMIASAKSSSEIKTEMDKLREEADKIKAEGEKLEEELAANATKTQTAIEQKAAIDQRIRITEREIENINAQIQQYGLMIAEKQDELEAAEAQLAEMNEAYRMRIRAMEENGSVSYWSILFKANSFSDLLDRIDSIQEVAEADQRMLREMRDITVSIEEDRVELQAQLEEQQRIKQELAEKEAELEVQREEADALLQQLADEEWSLSEAFVAKEDEEAYYRELIMQAQKDYEAALSREEAARLAEANKNNAAGSSSGGSSAGKGSFGRPLGSLSVTCAYGWRIHPIWGDRRFHSGVDLAANQGSPIYAIAAGTVTVATYGEANGYYVSLSHGNGYGRVYAHMTQYVSQGEIIGYVGSTGWSTGPHLHFEIHKNGQTVNPMEYIS